jgi:N-acetylglucosamine kinase-like BadF-type ATPase
MARVLGIDIGGTGSRARLSVEGVTVGETTTSSANPSTVGLAEALRVVDELLERLPLEDHGTLDAACIGAAGIIGASSEATKMFTERLGPLTSGGPVAVLPDVALVLPAAGLDNGVALICGTGSAAFGRNGDLSVRAGGWGYLVGDEASGYWVFRQALRTLLRLDDRRQPLGELGASLLAATGTTTADELRDQFYKDPWPGRWAALATVVLASPDPAARAILDEAARELDVLVGVVLESLGNPVGLPVVLAGGLTSDARFCDITTGYLATRRPGSTVSVLREPPVAGAVRLAARAAEGISWPVAS